MPRRFQLWTWLFGHSLKLSDGLFCLVDQTVRPLIRMTDVVSQFLKLLLVEWAQDCVTFFKNTDRRHQVSCRQLRMRIHRASKEIRDKLVAIFCALKTSID